MINGWLAQWSVAASLHGIFVLFLAGIVKGDESESRLEGGADVSRRTPWTTSRIVGSPEPPPPYETVLVFPKLKFVNPVIVTSEPGIDRMFVAEQQGKIYSFPLDQGCEKADVFAEMKGHGQGVSAVYGLTFHPRFEENHYVYICYIRGGDRDHGSVVSRFTMSQLYPPVCDLESEQILLTFRSGGHNGGCLKFGPRDGYLYISTGDAFSPFPPDGLETGQDNSDLLSAVLRIDVDRAERGQAYTVPPDNPFVKLPSERPEIWSYGFRNPWKMSFDAVTGDLWLGDVGWELWEMVHRLEPGGNYGWSVTEGNQPVRPEGQRGPTPIQPPVVAHPHSESRSITGGIVYYGKRLKDLLGAYVYGDYETGKFWALRYDAENRKLTWHEEIAQSTLRIVAFGADRNGEMYIADHQSGQLYQLRPSSASNQGKFPRRLSETGLFSTVVELEPEPGVYSYSTAAEAWADNATAERQLAVPGAAAVLASDQAAWVFPSGSVAVKTLSIEMELGDPRSRRRLETQLLRYNGKSWDAYAYEWNEDQTDAVLVPASGKNRILTIIDQEAPGGQRQQTWRFHSRAECLICHNTFSGYILGLNSQRMNVERDFSGERSNQLQTFLQMGLLETPSKTSSDLGGTPPLPDYENDALGVNDRARSYLHANCAHCHRRHSGGTSVIELPFELDLQKTNTLGVRPGLGAFGIADPQIVSPGDPYRSVLLYRVSALSAAHMPRIGARMVDRQGLDLLHRWIKELPTESINEEDPETGSALAKRRQVEQSVLEKLTATDGAADVRAAALDELLWSTSGALRLLRAIDEQSLPESVVNDAVTRATGAPNSYVRSLYTRFIPEEKRTKTLGTDFAFEQVLAVEGDADRGKQVFFNDTAAQCKNCHTVHGNGTPLGPDLGQVGKKYQRTELLETIVQPSKTIDPKYIVYVVVTKQGEIHNGLMLERSAEKAILRDKQGKLISVPAADIAAVTPQETSLMPDLLLREMTAQQVADLLEFLISSAQEEPAAVGGE